jgi:hypothetical protein
MQMQTRSKSPQEGKAGAKRPAHPVRVPAHVTCILADRCSSGSKRGFQPRIEQAVAHYADGFLPCHHWACTDRRGRAQSCAELHLQEGCPSPGRYQLDLLREALETRKKQHVCYAVNNVSHQIITKLLICDAQEEKEPEAASEPTGPTAAEKGKEKVLPGPSGWVPEEGTYDESEDEDEDEDNDLMDEDELAKWQAMVPFEPVLSLASFPDVEGESPRHREARLEIYEEETAEDLETESEQEEEEEEERVQNYEGPEFDELGFVSEADDVPYTRDVEQLVVAYHER